MRLLIKGYPPNQVFGMTSDLLRLLNGDLTAPQTIPKVNHNMKNLLFITAILLAIEELRQTKPQGFSTWEVTNRLREQVKNGEICFTDRQTEQVEIDGAYVDTFRVDRDEVRSIFNDLFANGVLKGLDKTYNRGGGYLLYVNRPPQAAPQGTATQPPVSGVTVTPTSISVVTAAVKSQGPFPTINNPLTQDRIIAYVHNSPSGLPRTMKQIQSRLKGHLATCEEIHKFLTSKGYATDGNNLPYSQRTVTMVK